MTIQPDCSRVDEFNGALQWFAVQVRPRWERAVVTSLESKGYECLLPLYERRRRWVDRIAVIEEPLFPGYVFCRWDESNHAKIVAAPGVMRLVGFGGAPTPVEEEEILAVQRIVESGILAAPHPYLSVGSFVRLLRGPLSGIEGVLVSVKPNHKLVVSVNLLQRSVAVEIEEHWLRPCEQLRLPAVNEMGSTGHLSRRKYA